MKVSLAAWYGILEYVQLTSDGAVERVSLEVSRGSSQDSASNFSVEELALEAREFCNATLCFFIINSM